MNFHHTVSLLPMCMLFSCAKCVGAYPLTKQGSKTSYLYCRKECAHGQQLQSCRWTVSAHPGLSVTCLSSHSQSLRLSFFHSFYLIPNSRVQFWSSSEDFIFYDIHFVRHFWIPEIGKPWITQVHILASINIGSCYLHILLCCIAEWVDLGSLKSKEVSISIVVFVMQYQDDSNGHNCLNKG